jgi:hypothetical protein
MTNYPQKDADYVHKPKWVDRMKGEEKVDHTPFKQVDVEQPVFYENDATKD